jgi:chromate transporter
MPTRGPADEPAGPAEERAAPPLALLFLVFLKMGAFAFGGVYSMLSFFERELVEKRRWLTPAEFAEGVAVGQMTPGPPIVNTGVFVGYRLRGARGAVAATLGQVLPGFVLVLVLAAFYDRFRSAPWLGGALRGVGAAVVGLLGSVVLKMGRQVVRGPAAAVLALAAFAALALAHLHPLAILAAAAAAGIALWGRRSP